MFVSEEQEHRYKTQSGPWISKTYHEYSICAIDLQETSREKNALEEITPETVPKLF
jgi:hypothetical protein